MLHFQGFAGFRRVHRKILNFPENTENTGQTSFFGFAGGSGQIVVRSGLMVGVEKPLLLQLRTQQDPECQAEIRILEIAAEQLRDVCQPV